MFEVIESNKDLISAGKAKEKVVYLVHDDWDDYSYRTTFYAYLFLRGRYEKIGNLKIGTSNEFYNHERGYINIPKYFETLPEEFFSIGSGLSFYKNFIRLVGKEKLENLNDVIFNNTLEYLYKKKYKVLLDSLLRDFSSSDYEIARRIIMNEDEFKNYQLYINFNSMELEFEVDHNKIIPTNLHAIIGGNGIGKTRILETIAKQYAPDLYRCDKDSDSDFIYTNINDFHSSKMIYITTSIFGNLYKINERSSNFNFNYAGFNNAEFTSGKRRDYIDSKEEIINDIIKTMEECKSKNRVHYLISFKNNFKFDRVLNTIVDNMLSYLNTLDSKDEYNIKQVLMNISSGHYVILYMVLKIALLVEERSIVLIDEPETHLYPPLLSAFIRSINDILKQKNALGIIATHSPIVLQEVPTECVWKLYDSKRERPSINTFGESVGVITRDVFRLQMEKSGFIKFIRELEYSKLEKIKNHVGSEALFEIYLRENPDDK